MFGLDKYKFVGTFLFWILWPLVWIYAPLRERVRVIIRCNGEILMVKNWFGPNSWQLPGGGMNVGESVSATASREIHEELGLAIVESKFRELTEEAAVIHRHGIRFHYHYALLELNTKPNILLSSEITATKWTSSKNVDLPITVSSSL